MSRVRRSSSEIYTNVAVLLDKICRRTGCVCCAGGGCSSCNGGVGAGGGGGGNTILPHEEAEWLGMRAITLAMVLSSSCWLMLLILVVKGIEARTI